MEKFKDGPEVKEGTVKVADNEVGEGVTTKGETQLTDSTKEVRTWVSNGDGSFQVKKEIVKTN